jgi:hypothetical protein
MYKFFDIRTLPLLAFTSSHNAAQKGYQATSMFRWALLVLENLSKTTRCSAFLSEYQNSAKAMFPSARDWQYLQQKGSRSV